jgi:hypothetical protein
MAMFIRIIILNEKGACTWMVDLKDYLSVQGKKGDWLLNYPVCHRTCQAFHEGDGMFVNVTSSTPFFKVFRIEPVSTEGSTAEVR